MPPPKSRRLELPMSIKTIGFSPVPNMPVMAGTRVVEQTWLPPPPPARKRRVQEGAPMRAGTAAKVAAIIQEANPNASQASAVYRWFHAWLQVNEHLITGGMGSAVAFWCASIEDFYAATTMVTYVQLLMKVFSRMRLAIEDTCLITDCLKCYNHRAANSVIRHAMDIDLQDAFLMYHHIQEVDVRASILLTTCTGARAEDATKLDHISITLDLQNCKLGVDFKSTKNRRAANQRYSIKVPLIIFPDAEVVAFLSSPHLIFPNADRINRVMAAAGLKGITTYSFRRLFIHTRIEAHTHDARTDWLAVIEDTGHKIPDNVKSHYAKKEGEHHFAKTKPPCLLELTKRFAAGTFEPRL